MGLAFSFEYNSCNQKLENLKFSSDLNHSYDPKVKINHKTNDFKIKIKIISSSNLTLD